MSDSTAVVVRESAGPLIRPTDRLSDVQRLGNLLAASGYFSDAREMAQAAVKVLAGEELGMPPIAAMMGISIIKGKVALGGNLIASRIRAHGYDYEHKQFDANGCVLVFKGKLDAAGKRKVLGESSFGEADAKAAGLLASDMYKKYPRNMYFNRAMSNGAKWYVPEVFAGAPVYTPEELGATVDEEGNVVEVIESSPVRESHDDLVARRIAEETAKIAAKTAAKAEPPKDPPSPFNAMLAKFAKAKAKIGSEHYYRILGEKGYQHANEVPDITTGEILLQEMRDVARAEAQFHATDADLPAELQGERQ